MFKKVRRLSKELAVKSFNACFNRSYGYVLMLHRVGKMDSDRLECIEELKVSIERLQRFVDKKKDKYDFISLQELELRLKDKSLCKRPFICFTFDDGFRDNLTQGLPFFERNNIPFAVFVTVNFIEKHPAFNYPFILERIIVNNESLNIENEVYDCSTREAKNKSFTALKSKVLNLPYDSFEKDFTAMFSKYLKPDHYEDLTMTWDEIRKLSESPLCTIGSHTMSHPRLSNVPANKLDYELNESKKTLEQHIGKTVKYISYPFGWCTDYNDLVLEKARNAGYILGFQSNMGCVRLLDRNCLEVKRLMLLEYEK